MAPEKHENLRQSPKVITAGQSDDSGVRAGQAIMAGSS
jgi:hypothetical protein